MTEIATRTTEVATTRIRFRDHADDFDASCPSDSKFLIIPLLGIGAGLLLRGSAWWVVALLAIPTGAVFFLLGMKRPSLRPWWERLIPSGPKKWQEGLVEISCSSCKRGLDWAPVEFMAEHPAAQCADCKRASVPKPNVIIPEVGSGQ